VSFCLAIAAAVVLLVWPVYSGFSGDRPTQATLLQINGSWVIVPVMFPLLVALVVRRQAVQIVAAIGFIASGQSPSVVSAADGTQFL
jgi:hypothetical protein